MTTEPHLCPKHIASADQFLAATRERLKHTTDAMRELLAGNHATIETELIALIDSLEILCEKNPEYRMKILANYVLAIHYLASQ